jgi:hypothetical protein
MWLSRLLLSGYFCVCPKHVNSLSTAIHELPECPRRSPAISLHARLRPNSTSVITSKAAMRDHFKNGQMSHAQDLNLF